MGPTQGRIMGWRRRLNQEQASVAAGRDPRGEGRDMCAEARTHRAVSQEVTKIGFSMEKITKHRP